MSSPRRRSRGCASRALIVVGLGFACAALAGTVAVGLGFAQNISALGAPAPGLDGPSRVMLTAYLLINAPWLDGAAGDPGQTVDLVVQEGESAQEVIDQLVGAGVVEDGTLLRRYLQYRGLDVGIQAGRYQLSGGMTVREIAETLQRAQAPSAEITIREGWRREQIAQQLDALRLGYGGGAFMEATQRVASDFAYAGQLPSGASLEGFLFPDTYQLDPDGSAADFVQALLENFALKIEPPVIEAYAAQDLSLHQAVTLASIVEREAVVSDERPLIAAVFLKRLNLGMPLEADPTVQYALGQQPGGAWWKSPLSSSDLGIESPYNTYRVGGLPPGPIANPGLDSLLSIARPADIPYLYFRAACDGSGRHLFAETFEEHLSNACGGGG